MKATLKRFRYHLLIAVGFVIAYLTACVWWHRQGRIGILYPTPPHDPFGKAAPPKGVFKWISKEEIAAAGYPGFEMSA